MRILFLDSDCNLCVCCVDTACYSEEAYSLFGKKTVGGLLLSRGSFTNLFWSNISKEDSEICINKLFRDGYLDLTSYGACEEL